MVINNNIFLLLFIATNFLLYNSVSAQVQVKLSEKNIAKVNNQDFASKKIKLYRKYYRKDSIKYFRKMERYWQARSDSITKSMRTTEDALVRKEHSVKDGFNTILYKTIYKPWAKEQASYYIRLLDKSGFCPSPKFRYFIRNYLETYFLNSTQKDSALLLLKHRCSDIKFPKPLLSKLNIYKVLNPDKEAQFRQLVAGKLGGFATETGKLNALQGKMQLYKNDFNGYSKYGKVLTNSDTLKGFAKAGATRIVTDYASRVEGLSQIENIKKSKDEVNSRLNLPSSYKAQGEQLQDSIYIREQAKKKAEELALKYVAANPGALQSIQAKASLLMRKYSVVPNSNDLSSAVKRSSLKGRKITERLVVAGNFQVLTLQPFSIDLSPQVGYKINRKFIIGTGGTYRQTFKDSIPTLAPSVFGYKAYSSYELITNLFAYAEFDRNTPGINKSENNSTRIWKNALFAGIGRKFLVHPKIEMTIIMTYNFLYKPHDPIYARPWAIRVGFQTSELAMLKR